MVEAVIIAYTNIQTIQSTETKIDTIILPLVSKENHIDLFGLCSYNISLYFV